MDEKTHIFVERTVERLCVFVSLYVIDSYPYLLDGCRTLSGTLNKQ